jgi:hypothetical protein
MYTAFIISPRRLNPRVLEVTPDVTEILMEKAGRSAASGNINLARVLAAWAQRRTLKGSAMAYVIRLLGNHHADQARESIKKRRLEAEAALMFSEASVVPCVETVWVSQEVLQDKMPFFRGIENHEKPIMEIARRLGEHYRYLCGRSGRRANPEHAQALLFKASLLEAKADHGMVPHDLYRGGNTTQQHYHRVGERLLAWERPAVWGELDEKILIKFCNATVI